MKYLTTLLLLCASTALAVNPTNNIAPATLTVVTDTNGVLQNPTNFFRVNSNAITAVVGSSGGASSLPVGTNMIPTGTPYGAGTGDFVGFGEYDLPVISNALYFIVIPGNGNGNDVGVSFIDDSFFSATGFLIAPTNKLRFIGQAYPSTIGVQIFPISNNVSANFFGTFSGTTTTNATVIDASLSTNVNFKASANEQNNVREFPALDNSRNYQKTWVAYNTDFDPNFGCYPTAVGLSNMIVMLGTNGSAAIINRIALDDGWMLFGARSGTNVLTCNTNFPGGLSSLINLAHSYGFDFQLYTSEGATTCCGYNSSQNYEAVDANYFGTLGIDALKVDFCAGSFNSEASQVLWSSLLYKTGRPIALVMSIDNNGHNLSYGSQLNTWEYGQQQNVANNAGFFAGLTAMILQATDTANGATGWPQQVGPGHDNDAGVLWVNSASGQAVTTNQCRLAVTAFAILASPYSIDGVPNTNQLAYFTNSEVYSILQDARHIRGRAINVTSGSREYYKPLQNGSVAVAFMNQTTNASSNLTVNWQQIGLPYGQTCMVRDPWNHVDLGLATNSYTASVGITNIVLLTVTPVVTNGIALQNVPLPTIAVTNGQPSVTFGTVTAALTGNAATATTATSVSGSVPAAQLTGTIATARLGSGTASSTTYLRGDSTWATPGGGGASFTSTNISLAQSAVTIAHGLGATPSHVRAVLVCTTADSSSGYAVGDEFDVGGMIDTDNSPVGAISFGANTTSVFASCAETGGLVGDEDFIFLPLKGGGEGGVSSFNNFRLKIYAQP